MDELFVAVKTAVPPFFSSESWYLIAVCNYNTIPILYNTYTLLTTYNHTIRLPPSLHAASPRNLRLFTFMLLVLLVP